MLTRSSRKKRRIETLYTAPPENSVVICLDEMEPQSAKSHDGKQQAVEKATTYRNQHKHPFVWGKRRRHKAKRKPFLATMPVPA